MAVTRKTEKKLEEMYNKINKEDLPHDTIDRGLMIDVMNKVLILADWYFDTYCSDFNKATKPCKYMRTTCSATESKTVKLSMNQHLGILYCLYLVVFGRLSTVYTHVLSVSFLTQCS